MLTHEQTLVQNRYLRDAIGDALIHFAYEFKLVAAIGMEYPNTSVK
jgi:hypothetical protein